VLAVNAWNEPRKKVEKFVAEKRLKYTILMNGREVLVDRYGCRYIPQVYVIDKQGVITYSHLNFQPGDEKELEAEVLKVL
jgi:peroxiredoxin